MGTEHCAKALRQRLSFLFSYFLAKARGPLSLRQSSWRVVANVTTEVSPADHVGLVRPK